MLEDARYLLSFLPQNNREPTPFDEPADPIDREAPELDTLVPDEPTKPYDIKRVIELVVDDGHVPRGAASATPRTSSAASRGSAATASASSATSRSALAGVLDIDSAAKAARFVRTCDAFNIPLVTFVDVPGFLPGTAQEWGGIIRHGAKLLYAYCEATVPKLDRDHAQGVRRRLRRDELEAHPRRLQLRLADRRGRGDGARGRGQHRLPQRAGEADDPDARRAELIADYRERFANPYVAAERGYVDDVIEPRRTRPVLIDALRTAITKREPRPQRKHGNIPL